MANELRFFTQQTGGVQIGTVGNPIQFTALNTPVTVWAETESGEGAPTFTLDKYALSVDDGTNYVTTGALPDIGPSPRRKVLIEQTSVGATNTITFSHPSPFNAGSAPSLSGSLTIRAVTPGTTVTLDCSDATDNVGVDHYNVEYGTTLSYGTSTTSTTSDKTITGLNGGTLYYFRMNAADGAGNVSSWLTGSITTGYNDLFNGTGSPSASYWSTSTYGNGTVALNGSGELVMTFNTQLTGDAAAVYRTAPLVKGMTYAVRAKASPVTGVSSNGSILTVLTGASIPTPQPVATMNGYTLHSLRLSRASGGTPDFVDFIKWNSSGTVSRWQSSGAPASWGASTTDTTLAFTPGTYYWAILETTSTQWRYILKNSDMTSTLQTTDWVNWATDTRAMDTNLWICSGAYSYSYQSLVTLDEWREWTT